MKFLKILALILMFPLLALAGLITWGHFAGHAETTEEEVFFVTSAWITHNVNFGAASAPWDTEEFRNHNLSSALEGTYENDYDETGESIDDEYTGASEAYEPIQRTGIATNFALADILVSFNYNRAGFVDNPIPQGAELPRLSLYDRRLSNIFIDIFAEGFEQDSLSLVMPFNADYVRYILNEVTIYFAPESDEVLFAGWYAWSTYHNINNMFIGTTDPNEYILEEFEDYYLLFGSPSMAITSIHEVGRALGLHDSLTSLFSEVFLDIRRFWEIGFWDYGTCWDRLLMYSAGDEVFWRAAFTSNEAYGALWNEHLGYIIPYDDLMMARGVMTVIQRTQRGWPWYLEHENGNALIEGLIERTGNSNITDILETLPLRFYRAQTGALPEALAHSEIYRIAAVIEDLSAFGAERDVLPFHSVDNYVIYRTLPAGFWDEINN